MVPPMEQGMATAFSNVVMGKLFSELEKKYHLWKGVKEVSESLRRDLEILVSHMDEEVIKLRDARRTPVARVHTAQMRDLTHDIEDCIELFLHRVTCEEGASLLSRVAHRVKTVKTRYRFAVEMKKLKKRLKDTSLSYTSTAAPAEGDQPYPVEHDPVGIALAKAELLALLDEVEGQRRRLRVISIVGFGGSGKTTLARAVYDSPQAQHPLFCCGAQSPRFCRRAWVDRCEYTDARGLLKKIIQEVWPEAGQDVLEETNEERLRNHLRGYLKDKRYLIVMDDIDGNLCKWITSTFEDNGTSSRIIVTTTFQSTADFCSSDNGYVYKMRTLGDAASKKIALLDTFDLEHSLTLLKKCDGLPLALVSVADHFRSKKGPTENLCKKLCGRLGSYLHLHETAKDNMDHFARLRGVLMGNYTSLPDYTDPSCLLYLGIFPNDRPLKRNVMIRRWVAEGYARSNNPLECSEQQVADDNFEQFLNRNIIQPVGISNDEVLKTCKTHGIVHEFMLHKSISENFIMPSDALKHKKHKKVRHLFVKDRNDINSGTTLNVDLSRVRSLTVSGNAGGAFSNFRKYKLMRVLDLEECRDVNDHHLKDICNLWNLRYLSLGPNITELPREIAKLKLLETLHGSKTRVNVLPVEVIGLPCLTHLIGKFKLPHQDRTVSSDLEQRSKNSKLETLAGFVADGSQGFLQLMGHMNNLRKVKMWCESTGDITNLNKDLVKAIQKYTEAPMCGDRSDRSLSIDLQGLPGDERSRALRGLCNQSSSPENQSSSYLRSLKLHGNVPTLHKFVKSLLCGLSELCLSLTAVTQDLLSALSNMPRLAYLKLIACQIDKNLVIKVGVFKKLRHLRIMLPGPNPVIPQIQDGALPELVSLQLLCEHLAGLSGIVITHLENLKEIELDPGVSDQTRGEWEAAAMNHPNRPDVLPFKSVDDPMGNEPPENPVIPEEAAPEVGIQGQRVDEGPEPYAMRTEHSVVGGEMDDSTYIEPTENPIAQEEAAPDTGIQEQPVEGVFAQENCAVQSSPGDILNSTCNNLGLRGERNDSTDSEPLENPVAPEESIHEDGIQERSVEEGPQRSPVHTEQESSTKSGPTVALPASEEMPNTANGSLPSNADGDDHDS